MTDRGFSRSDWLRLLFGVACLILFMFRPRLTLVVVLLGIGGVFIAYNARIFWIEVILKEHSQSVLPIVGGILAGAGIALLPESDSWKWAWIPLLIDWGGLPSLVGVWYEQRSRE